jgi:hypothetical protein
MHVTGLRTVGGVGVAAHFNLEVLKGCSVVRFEQIVQDLAPLRFGIVDQQPGGGSGADPSDPLENSTAPGTIDFDFRFLDWLLAGY